MNHFAASHVISALGVLADPDKAIFLQRFFKTAPGEYAHGDQFRGLTVPAQRKIVRQFSSLPLDQISILLFHPVHECRLTGLLILVGQYQSSRSLDQKKKIVDCYLEHLDGVNNRDLVDSSADKILGAYLFETNTPYPLLETLAHSSDRYRRRVAMIATFFRIKQGKTDVPLCLARLLLKDTHSLMHKAVGRMLRELGKRCDRQILKDFLDEMAPVMPRTALRYAIEHFSPDERKRYLSLKYSIQ